MRIADGKHFLHWSGRRKAEVLYIDGEMSRRLLKARLGFEVERLGSSPKTFHALSHEDVEDFRPLNTEEGTKDLIDLIDESPVDLIIFDNIMSLLVGSMREEEPWAEAMPLVRELTRRNVGQLWIHHSGHDKTRGYGSSTRTWQLDTVIHLDAVERRDTDVSFRLHFQKARERTPETRSDFQDLEIALVFNEWEYKLSEGPRIVGKVSPQGTKYLDALKTAVNGPDAVTDLPVPKGRKAVTTEVWVRECTRVGLIDQQAKDNSKRALISKYRRELITAAKIACADDLTWIMR
jgi:hypothetical protein